MTVVSKHVSFSSFHFNWCQNSTANYSRCNERLQDICMFVQYFAFQQYTKILFLHFCFIFCLYTKITNNHYNLQRLYVSLNKIYIILILLNASQTLQIAYYIKLKKKRRREKNKWKTHKITWRSRASCKMFCFCLHHTSTVYLGPKDDTGSCVSSLVLDVVQKHYKAWQSSHLYKRTWPLLLIKKK